MDPLTKKFRLASSLFTLFLITSSCNGGLGKKDEAEEKSNPSEVSDKTQNDGVIEQPDNVAGAFGLYMECSLAARQSSDNGTRIGCALKGNRGEKFVGKVSDLKVTVYVAGSEKGVEGIAEVVTNGGSYDFVVRIEGDGKAISLEAKFNADGKNVTLNAPIYSVQLKATADITLHVAPTGTDTMNCSESAPCGLISQALAILPERFDHAVQIKVAAGVYKDYLEIRDFSFGVNGSLVIEGPGASPLSEGRFEVDSSEFGQHAVDLINLQGPITIKNGVVKGGAEKNGLNIRNCNRVYLENVRIYESHHGIFAGASSKIFSQGSLISKNNANSGVVLNETSSLFVLDKGASVEITANGGVGFSVQKSNVEFFGASLVVDSNTTEAMQILNGSTFLGAEFGKISLRSSTTVPMRVEGYSSIKFRRYLSPVPMEFEAISGVDGAVVILASMAQMEFQAADLKVSIRRPNHLGSPSVSVHKNSMLVVSINAQCVDCAGSIYLGFLSGAIISGSPLIPGTGTVSYSESSPVPTMKNLIEGRLTPP